MGGDFRATAPAKRAQLGRKIDELERLAFELDFAEYLGGATWLYGRAGPDAPLTVAARGSTLPEPGARLRLGFDPADMYLFDERGLRLR